MILTCTITLNFREETNICTICFRAESFWQDKKIMYALVNLGHSYCIKVGLEGSKLY